jgi:hypothetical protein
LTSSTKILRLIRITFPTSTIFAEGSPHYKIFSIVPNGLVPRGMRLTAAEERGGGLRRPLRQLSKVSCSKDVGVPFFFHLVGVVKKGSMNCKHQKLLAG